MDPQVLFCAFVHLLQIQRRLELDDYGSPFDPGQVILEYVRGVHDDHGHHRDAAFLGYLEASLPEREEGVVHFVAGALREDAQGDAALDLLHAIQDRFQALLDIVPVQEQAVDVAHPVHQQRVSCHLLLRHIAGLSFAKGNLCQ